MSYYVRWWLHEVHVTKFSTNLFVMRGICHGNIYQRELHITLPSFQYLTAEKLDMEFQLIDNIFQRLGNNTALPPYTPFLESSRSSNKNIDNIWGLKEDGTTN